MDDALHVAETLTSNEIHVVILHHTVLRVIQKLLMKMMALILLCLLYEILRHCGDESDSGS